MVRTNVADLVVLVPYMRKLRISIYPLYHPRLSLTFFLKGSVRCYKYPFRVCNKNVMSLLGHGDKGKGRQWDVVVDCTDNIATRYCLNDACALIDIPLVYGASVRTDGQVTVYNHRTVGGPCMRCIFPKPLLPQNRSGCSDAGVLGIVPGIIGCMQGVDFYTQVKTITSLWREEDIKDGIRTSMPVLGKS